MVVTIYSKPNCSLCEDAKTTLHSLQARFGFQLFEVDIRLDPALYEKYRYEIPVVLLDGVEVARHVVDEAALSDLIRRGMAVADSTGG